MKTSGEEPSANVGPFGRGQIVTEGTTLDELLAGYEDETRKVIAAFSQIRPGMEQGEVQVLLGPPDEVDATIMPWGWLLVTPGAWHYVYHYHRLGRVTFSGSVHNAMGTVSRIETDGKP